jgi:hypothetical protein
MRGGEENAAAGFFRLQIVLQSFVTDPLGNVLAIDVRKTRKRIEQPADRPEHFVGYRGSFCGSLFRVSQLQIANCHAA